MIHGTLIIFLRNPVPGTTKTRLIPACGTHGAAYLQDRMTRRTLETAAALQRVRPIHIEICVAGDVEAVRRLYPGPWHFASQGDGDLGARLARAVEQSFHRDGGPCIVIGSDCPSLGVQHLSAALDALQGHDAVVGPAADGGYYLLGQRRHLPGVFAGIDWSTDRVLDQTRAALSQLGASTAELPVLEDIDRPEDLRLMPSRKQPRRIAITGATGMLGMRFLERMLAGAPDMEVAALVRRESRGATSERFRSLLAAHGSRITLIDADLRSLDVTSAEKRLLAEADGGLWHFAADTRLRPGSVEIDRDMAVINDEGTHKLVNLLLTSDAPGPMYHVSTAYVSGGKTGVVLEEAHTTHLEFRNGYERSKHAAERHVRAAFERGLTGCILRPSLVVGDEREQSSMNAADLLVEAGVESAIRAAGPLVLKLPPHAGVNVVHADWVLEATLAIADLPTPAGTTYHLTAREPVRLSAFSDLPEELAGCRLVLNPNATELPTLSRSVNRVVNPLRSYLTGDVTFDRTNLERDVPSVARLREFDPFVLLRHRLFGSASRN